MRLLVSMGLKPSGRARDPLRPWLVELDAASGQTLRTRTHEAPSSHTAGAAVHQEFTAAHLAADGALWQPTHTELLRIDARTLETTDYLSHPLMHGVHSATPTPSGGVLLSCAGIDSVIALDASGRLADHVFLRPQPFHEVFPPGVDHRRVHYDAYKPHSHHPNHAVVVNGERFVTCFETQACHRLDGGAPIAGFGDVPHDGRLRDGALWFTTVRGQVFAYDLATSRWRLRLDLRTLDPTPGLLGWCRGVEVVGDRLFVGFSMLRRARAREALRWLVQGETGRKRPTRVVEIDLRGPRIVREILVGNAVGGTIYAITAVPDAG